MTAAARARAERNRLALEQQYDLCGGPRLEGGGTDTAQASLYAFVRAAWRQIEPSTPYMDNWHIAYLCEFLECITFGEAPCVECCENLGIEQAEIHALVINIPPRYMKSTIVTVMWPAWEWTLRPHLRYLAASYSQTLSTKHSMHRRRIIESAWYQGLLAHNGQEFTLTDDQNQKTAYENTASGSMLATSMTGSATGDGGDRVIIDDPTNPKQSESAAHRETANSMWDMTFSSRLNDKNKGAFVIVMQRLHQSDLTGHVLQEGGWVHVVIQNPPEKATRYVFPRSGRVIEREAGAILHEKREGTAKLALMKRRLGSYGYAGQYLQRPTPAEGGIIKRADIRYWVTKLHPDDDPAKVVLLPPNLTGHRQSWDFGLWGNARDDYSVGLVGARVGANAYILDCVRKRMGLAACIEAIKALTIKWPQAVRKVIENAANGPEVIKKLKASVPGMVPKPPKGDKEARLMGVQPVFESGNVFFPHPREAGWVADCVEELLGFPFADHDDFVDALSQLISDFDLNAVADSGAGMSGARSTPAPTRPGGTADVGIARRTAQEDD